MRSSRRIGFSHRKPIAKSFVYYHKQVLKKASLEQRRGLPVDTSLVNGHQRSIQPHPTHEAIDEEPPAISGLAPMQENGVVSPAQEEIADLRKLIGSLRLHLYQLEARVTLLESKQMGKSHHSIKKSKPLVVLHPEASELMNNNSASQNQSEHESIDCSMPNLEANSTPSLNNSSEVDRTMPEMSYYGEDKETENSQTAKEQNDPFSEDSQSLYLSLKSSPGQRASKSSPTSTMTPKSTKRTRVEDSVSPASKKRKIGEMSPTNSIIANSSSEDFLSPVANLRTPRRMTHLRAYPTPTNVIPKPSLRRSPRKVISSKPLVYLSDVFKDPKVISEYGHLFPK